MEEVLLLMLFFQQWCSKRHNFECCLIWTCYLLINRSSVTYELRDWPHRSSSLRCRWAPLGPRIRPRWKHPVFRTRLVRKSGKTIKSVFNKYFLRPKNIVLWKNILFNNVIFLKGSMWLQIRKQKYLSTLFGQRKRNKETTTYNFFHPKNIVLF